MKAKKVMALMLCAAMVTRMSATELLQLRRRRCSNREIADSTAAEDLLHSSTD